MNNSMNYLILEKCMSHVPKEPKIAAILNNYDIARLLSLMRNEISPNIIPELSQVAVWIPSLLKELERYKSEENLRGSLIEVRSPSVADFLLEKIEIKFSATQLYSCLWYALIGTHKEISDSLLAYFEQKDLVFEKATAG